MNFNLGLQIALFTVFTRPEWFPPQLVFKLDDFFSVVLLERARAKVWN